MKEWKINLNLLNARSQGISSKNFEAQIMMIQTDAMIAQAERLEGIYEVLTKIAEGGDKITLGPITMTAPEWLAQINRKFDQVDLLVSNKFRELLTRVADLEAKIAEQASAPVTSDTAQEAREVLQMIADADTGTIQVDIDDEIASSDCRHCEWMKERAKEYLESHPAPVESHPCGTNNDIPPTHEIKEGVDGPVVCSPTQKDEAKWPTVDVFAGIMKERLEANKDKGGWKDCTAGYLTKRLDEETRELTHTLVEGNLDNIRHEAADVANFAMMIADNAESIVARLTAHEGEKGKGNGK